MTSSNPDKYHVPSVESACHILRAVCESDDPLSMAEVNEVTEGSRTTVMRIVSSLCHNGLLQKNEQGKLHVGDVMRMLSSRIHSQSNLRQRAVPILKDLAEKIGETSHLAIPLETHCILQEVVDGPQLVRVASRPGTLIDYHCSVTGKSILAFRNDLLSTLRQSITLTRRTKNTITAWDDFDAALEQVRERGYAIDEEEYHEGVRCVGAPVYDSSGVVIAAIGVTGTSARLTKRRIPAVAKLIIDATAQLSDSSL